MNKVRDSDTAKKVIIGICVGFTLFLATDFITGRVAQASCDARQDAEISELRRDVDRIEGKLERIQQVSLEILHAVKGK